MEVTGKLRGSYGEATGKLRGSYLSRRAQYEQSAAGAERARMMGARDVGGCEYLDRLAEATLLEIEGLRATL